MTAATVINAGYATAFLLLGVSIWRVSRRPRRPSLEARVAAARERTTSAPVIDTEPGINLGDHDECELLWDLPAYTGVDRLLDAIRDEQHKGDQ